MADLLDIFQFAFMQRALMGGVLVALLSSILGVFVVQRGLSFLGDGLAHASFAGVALGILLGIEQPLWIALPYTVSVALGIAWLRNHTHLSSDTAIGVLFALSVALGVMFISLRDGYTVDAWHLLFGSILAVGQDDIVIMLVMTVTVSITLWLVWGKLAYATFDSDLAQADGVNVKRLEYLLFGLASVVIVMSVKVVGVILIAAYIVIPAAAAKLVAPSLASMTLISLAVGVLSTLVGLSASYLLDVPSGSTIILCQTLAFAGLGLVGKLGARA
ncbi:MAG: metal ABC transporter permease [Deinococcota bacterium]